MRLIDADALLKKYCKEEHKGDCKNCDWFGDSWCRCEIFGVQIADAPTVDAVAVVRCADCVFYRYAQDWNGNRYKACYQRADVIISKRKQEDFCSYGERRC